MRSKAANTEYRYFQSELSIDKSPGIDDMEYLFSLSGRVFPGCDSMQSKRRVRSIVLVPTRNRFLLNEGHRVN